MRPGSVLKAVIHVLETTDQPMRACHVHAAVVELLRQDVKYSAVKGCLASKAHGRRARFERTARGCYRLRTLLET